MIGPCGEEKNPFARADRLPSQNTCVVSVVVGEPEPGCPGLRFHDLWHGTNKLEPGPADGPTTAFVLIGPDVPLCDVLGCVLSLSEWPSNSRSRCLHASC